VGTVYYYCAQVTVRPPTFAIFCNDPSLFGGAYRRYLEQVRRMGTVLLCHCISAMHCALQLQLALLSPSLDCLPL
jgi:hypothetical protein